MGKFINTTYYDTQNALVQMNQDLVQNPFYLFNDKKGTRVKYYNINDEKSTLDPGSKMHYADLGDDSPIRYNVVHDLYLYQFIKAELNFDNGEFGLESSPIEGESYILPNTIIPRDGDYFEVDHIKDSTWLFKVTNVQRDTLENGANVYKISWVIDRTTNKEILNNVVEEYKYVDIESGTNLKAVVKMEKYDIALKLDQLSATLADYFKDLYYSDKIQTFTYLWYNMYHMYDPFVIEFIIRNKLLQGTDGYIYIDHQMKVPNTFSIDYNKTIYSAFEERSIEKLKLCKYQSQADYIDSPISIFATRFENYYALNYKVINQEVGPFNPNGIIPILSEELMNRIVNNIKYKNSCKNRYNNIFIKYFHNEDITNEDIDSINDIDFEDTKDIFYKLILLIFCIDFYTKKLLS